MRTIKEILKDCNDDLELLACVICLVFGYVFIAAIFWCNIGWQCGVLSVFLTYCICEATCVLKDWFEAQNDEMAEIAVKVIRKVADETNDEEVANESEHEDEQEGVQ